MSKIEYDVLSIESGDYRTTYNRMYLTRKQWEATNPKHILSFMPGTVEEIKVKVGDAVKQGQVLMVFRAMKMNNKILCPVNGKVKRIEAKVGENVPKDTLMIEIG